MNSQSEISSWGVGWRTPAFMIFCYLIALFAAIISFVFFRFLDGSRADDQDKLVFQSYVNTISHTLPSVFQIALQASLSAAFVQYIWFTLQRFALKVSTIETLFLIRSQPLLFFKLTALRNTWLLFFIASLIWATYIATIFPPGALTIRQAPYRNNTMLTVPTFNSSYIGNGSILDAQTYSLDSLGLYYGMTYSTVIESHNFPHQTTPELQRLARNVILNGEVTKTPSPCGANCSYITTFDGPYFGCNSSTSTIKAAIPFTEDSSLPVIYSGAFNEEYISNSSIINNLSPAKPVPIFTITTQSLIATLGWGNNTPEHQRQVMSKQILTCTPFRARYVVNNTYKNNVQVTEVSPTPVRPIAPFNPAIYLLPANKTTALTDLYDMGDWSGYSLEWYSNINIGNLISAVAVSLNGTYSAGTYQNWTIPDTKIAEYGDILWSLNNTWLDGISDPYLPQNRPTIADSKLNYYLNHASPKLPVPPGGYRQDFPSIKYAITQELLNELLQNITLSAIASYVNLYAFSSPKQLILPYLLSQTIILPFTILGLWALYSNGVPASDGSFIEMITTIGSATLEREAVVGYPSSQKDISPKLRDMRIKFGELIDGQEGQKEWDNKVVRRAGFGTAEEIVPLNKGARYGRPRSVDTRAGWI